MQESKGGSRLQDVQELSWRCALCGLGGYNLWGAVQKRTPGANRILSNLNICHAEKNAFAHGRIDLDAVMHI